MDYFICPLCGANFDIQDFSLKCAGNHNYDLAKKGYANLFNGYTKINKTYDRQLFTARKLISDAGLYSGLVDKICTIVGARIARPQNPTCPQDIAILDAGCGCGNLSHAVYKNTGAAMFAVDLSKDGIEFAAANFCENNLIWLVANLNNLPFADNKFDIILNIMSPANYHEFKRVIKPGGVLIKVMPDADYLKELRRFIYQENDRQDYTNKEVLNNLAENMTINELIDMSYTHSVTAENIHALFDMTPLTANINEREQIKNKLSVEIVENKNFNVTLAFKIAICGANM